MKRTQMELIYLMNVIKYAKTTDDILTFIQVNKKCQETIKAFQQNFNLGESTLKKELMLLSLFPIWIMKCTAIRIIKK